MKNRTLHAELGLYLLIFGAALALRLIGLARNPLTGAEATLALQALDLARGGSPVLVGQPGYIVLTGMLFFLTQATEFTARLLPAIAGSLVVWAVYLFRPRIGRTAALILAVFLAIDPGLVAASRQANGLIFAVSAGLLAASLLYRRMPVAGGIFAGLALLGGPSAWMGLLIAALTLFTAGVFAGKRAVEEGDDAGIAPSTWPWRAALPYFAGAVLLLGTLFLWAPAGVSALFTSLTTFLGGWVQASTLPAGRMFMLLGGYGLLALFLGLAGGVSALISRRRTDLFLLFWFLAALILVVLYPARQAPDLVWALVPLWALGARQAARWLDLIRSDAMAFAGQTALVFVLLVFTWLTFVSLSSRQSLADLAWTNWLTIIGSILLMLVVAILIAWGWSVHAALGGLVWGVTLVLLIATLSGAVNAAGLGRRPAAEMWHRSPYVDQADLLMMTAHNVALWNTRASDALDLIVVDAGGPALAWALRDYDQSSAANVLMPGTNPSMVITPEEEQPSLAAEYTGQSFVWQRLPIWEGINWLRWYVVRALPMRDANVILWVRSDLLPGAATDVSVEP